MAPQRARNAVPEAATGETPRTDNSDAELQLGADKRRYRRVVLHMHLRYLLPDGRERAGELIDISAGGLAIKSEEPVSAGDHIIIYIDGLGRFEGAVVRTLEEGFAVELKSNQRKREKTADQLTWAVNEQSLGLKQERRHTRVNVRKSAELKRADGSVIMCRVVDMSLSGLAVEISEKLPIGEIIKIGQMEGRVVRHFPNGVGVEFLHVKQPRRNLTDSLY